MKIRQVSRQLGNHHEVLEDINKAMKKNLTFGTGPGNLINNNDQSQNIAGVWAKRIAPATPDTEFAVTHNLGYVPTGFDVKKKSLACDVYDGDQPWTSEKIFLKATVASVALTLFILG